MKLSRFGAFTLGVVMTAVSVGTVSYVTAANDSAYTACANKKTGAMRLLTKGKCRSTETTVRWNQQGPQGLPGAQGVAGPKGDTGPQGSAGLSTSGIDGQNLYAIGANGQTIGLVTQAGGDYANVLVDGGLYEIHLNHYRIGPEIYWFLDAACSQPLGMYATEGYDSRMTGFPPQKRFILAKGSSRAPTAAYKPTGVVFDAKTLAYIYQWNANQQSCTRYDPTVDLPTEYLYATFLTPVALPVYTGPVQIVAR